MSMFLLPSLLACLLFESAQIDLENPECIAPDCEALLDMDGDGYSLADGDCDDADSSVYPSAPEVCDLIDNDCDERIDWSDSTSGDLQAGYWDADGDGFGTTVRFGCTTTSAWSGVGGDCDDSNPDVHPEADEICDTIDNDCDEAIDDADDTLTAPIQYVDLDGDGYGSTDTVIQCSTDGAAAIFGDCNDMDHNISPAIEEVENDLIDQNCDGVDILEPTDCGLDMQGVLIDCTEVLDVSGREMSFQRIEAGLSPVLDYAVTYPFAIMNLELSNQQAKALQFQENSQNGINRAPIDSISWHDAAMIANLLTTYVNQSYEKQFSTCYDCINSTCVPVDSMDCTGYRMPTSAEWELASRAGTILDFALDGTVADGGALEPRFAGSCVSPDTFFTDTSVSIGDVSWYCGNSQISSRVGELLPNGFGLYDMQGNIAEWVHDVAVQADDFVELSGDDPWVGIVNGTLGMARGGAYIQVPSQLSNTQAQALIIPVDTKDSTIGVRFVRRLPY